MHCCLAKEKRSTGAREHYKLLAFALRSTICIPFARRQHNGAKCMASRHCLGRSVKRSFQGLGRRPMSEMRHGAEFRRRSHVKTHFPIPFDRNGPAHSVIWLPFGLPQLKRREVVAGARIVALLLDHRNGFAWTFQTLVIQRQQMARQQIACARVNTIQPDKRQIESGEKMTPNGPSR